MAKLVISDDENSNITASLLLPDDADFAVVYTSNKSFRWVESNTFPALDTESANFWTVLAFEVDDKLLKSEALMFFAMAWAVVVLFKATSNPLWEIKFFAVSASIAGGWFWTGIETPELCRFLNGIVFNRSVEFTAFVMNVFSTEALAALRTYFFKWIDQF